MLWLFPSKRRGERATSEEHLLRIAVDLKPGGEFMIDSTGSITGIQKQLVDLLRSDRDSVEWVPFTDRGKALSALSRNEVQLYATSYPYAHKDYLDNIEATEWLYLSSFALLFKKESGNPTWQEAIEANLPIVVHVSTQEPNASVVLENIKELAYPALMSQESNETITALSLKLVLGEIEYLLCSYNTAHAIAEVDTTLMLVDDISFKARQVWLVNSEAQALKEALDSAIIRERETETWKEIVRQ